MTDWPQVIVRAGGSGELIVWVVLGIVWAIAQAVTRAREKRRRPAPPRTPDSSAGKMHQELEEFFAQLQRQHEDGAAPAPLPPAQERPMPRQIPVTVERTPPPLPEIRVRRKKPRIQVPVAAPPIPLPQQPAARPAEVMSEPAPILSASEYDYSAPVAKQRRSEAAQLRMISDSKGFAMRGIGLISDRSRRAAPEIRMLFSGRSAMRNSWIGRIVLGPSRAAQPWSYPSD